MMVGWVGLGYMDFGDLGWSLSGGYVGDVP